MLWCFHVLAAYWWSLHECTIYLYISIFPCVFICGIDGICCRREGVSRFCNLSLICSLRQTLLIVKIKKSRALDLLYLSFILYTNACAHSNTYIYNLSQCCCGEHSYSHGFWQLRGIFEIMNRFPLSPFPLMSSSLVCIPDTNHFLVWLCFFLQATHVWIELN